MTAAATTTRTLRSGLSAFVWLLPFHVVAMAFLFGGLRWPAAVVRVVAAWKELAVLALFVVVLWRVARRRPRAERAAVRWLDVAVGTLGILAFGYLLGADVWFDAGLPLVAQLYGLRDTAFVSLLYFVGRATPEVVGDGRLLRALFVVGVVTSAIAVLERLLVTPAMLVLLGAASYVQQFLGATPGTLGEYGLSSNYWTQFGGHMVRRVGSTYLSAQGFAISFLIILPAATLWMLSHERRPRLAWPAYALLWIALALTITRMTIAACVIEVVVIAVTCRRWGLAAGLPLAALGALGLAMLAVPGLATYVWQTLTWQSGSSVSHLHDWSVALDNLARFPLGAGLGSTDVTAARYGLTPLAADNQYFKFALELGVPGLVLQVAILVGILVAGVRGWRAADGEPARTYGMLLAVTALGVMLNALTAGVFNSPMLTYIFLFLAGAVVSAGDRAPAPLAARA